MPHVYVTGHKNPDTDTIASAIAYAEYKNLVDPENHYSPARLGEVNAQTGWALESDRRASRRRPPIRGDRLFARCRKSAFAGPRRDPDGVAATLAAANADQ